MRVVLIIYMDVSFPLGTHTGIQTHPKHRVGQSCLESQVDRLRPERGGEKRPPSSAL